MYLNVKKMRLKPCKKAINKEGEILVIRNEGPKGGPGMREMLATTARHLRARHG